MGTKWENYKVETHSLLKTLEGHGFRVNYVKDGEGYVHHDGFVDNLMSCEEGTMYVDHLSTNTNTWVYLVYGNSPGELVCDYGVSKNVNADKALDTVVEKHYEQWG